MRCREGRWRALTLVGLALYAAFLLAAPFEHHDLTCELKTPQHCAACTTTIISSDLGMQAIPGTWPLADAGRALAVDAAAETPLLVAHTNGRSPPVFS